MKLELKILEHIYKNSGCSLSNIQYTCRISYARVLLLVSYLISKNLVTKEKKGHSAVLNLTEDGLELIPTIEKLNKYF
jgi:predicted transcriptional regulator